ncbi:MAG: phosphoribosylformylglycinamidine synthase I [Phycisphaerales bacterium]|jgi:phosphoribosylformylglycinamidine synthase I
MAEHPRAFVLRTAGTNCDAEMVRAFELAGASVELVHLDAVCADPTRLDACDLIGFPGGFSYGDDIASGRIFAMRVREKLYPALRRAAQRGVCMIGACNGFQVMVQAGLLPGPAAGEPWPDEAPRPTIGLATNAQARFVDRWVGFAVEPGTSCVWTDGLEGRSDEQMVLPVAHGEGRIVADQAVLQSLKAGGHVAVRYTEDVNGSAGQIAGVCDATGRLFGLMPHPERYLDWNRHPSAARLDRATCASVTPGLAMFESAVAAVRGQLA